MDKLFINFRLMLDANYYIISVASRAHDDALGSLRKVESCVLISSVSSVKEKYVMQFSVMLT